VVKVMYGVCAIAQNLKYLIGGSNLNRVYSIRIILFCGKISSSITSYKHVVVFDVCISFRIYSIRGLDVKFLLHGRT
jgi:hypothetical protein